MSFTNLKLHESSTCVCMDGAEENTTTTFMRRISVTGRVKHADFKPRIDREVPPTAETCDDFCALREVSINDVDNYEEGSIVEIYKQDLMNNKANIFAPQLRLSYCKFKFVADSGHVKYTPHHGHNSHFDFYRKDTFDHTALQGVICEFVDFPNAQVQARPD